MYGKVSLSLYDVETTPPRDLCTFLMAVQRSPCKLFDRCVREILQSLALSEKAAVYLPQNVCYYILHKACQDKNLAAVEKIVSAWSYPTLSFNFQLYPLRSESSHTCLLAPEYADVYSSVDLSPCITSIAIGLFNNVYRGHVYCDTPGGRKGLQEVDLSNFHASFDNSEWSYFSFVYLLCDGTT